MFLPNVFLYSVELCTLCFSSVCCSHFHTSTTSFFVFCIHFPLFPARSSSRRICGSAASSSDSETADDAPLLPDEGPSHAVRLEMPGDKPASPHDRFPKTPLKTLVAFLMLVVAAAGNTITLSWIHERYPLTPPLPDIVFELIPKIPWGLRLCENLMIGSFVSLLVLILFHR